MASVAIGDTHEADDVALFPIQSGNSASLDFAIVGMGTDYQDTQRGSRRGHGGFLMADGTKKTTCGVDLRGRGVVGASQQCLRNPDFFAILR